MSRTEIIKQRCAVCWRVSNYFVLTSTNAMGSPDLDLRPPGMERSILFYQQQHCKRCGYVAYDIRQYAKGITKKRPKRTLAVTGSAI